MIVPSLPDDAFLAAGSPWFFTLFGRDSIWAARLLLPFGWELAAGTLRALAAFQGRTVDPRTAEAPGKIPHELRRGGSLYYGSIDATPLWICLLHDAWRWGMPDEQVRVLLPSLRAALKWMRDHGDADGDGFLEYIDESGGRGLANQGWKDSGDSVRFADGSIASPPVALCEVQGYAHEAAVRGADLLDHFGEPDGGRWREWAGGLAAKFRESFWVDGYPALALDADKRRVDSLTSNIGHLLGTGLLTAPEEAMVAERLSGDDMDSGFGLRTMSARDGGYNPLSYHCGSVWTHDTGIVVRGLFRSGHVKTGASLADGLLRAAAAFGWRLPELYSGDAGPRPVPYPAACRPQAWSAASIGAVIQGLLGLDVDVPSGTVTVRPPGVRLGGAGLRLHVDGLVAGSSAFSAGVTDDGRTYLRDCPLKLIPLRLAGLSGQHEALGCGFRVFTALIRFTDQPGADIETGLPHQVGDLVRLAVVEVKRELSVGRAGPGPVHHLVTSLEARQEVAAGDQHPKELAERRGQQVVGHVDDGVPGEYPAERGVRPVQVEHRPHLERQVRVVPARHGDHLRRQVDSGRR
jgi:hypothetical protein